MEQIPVERAVLSGLQHVVRPDVRAVFEIGEGARHIGIRSWAEKLNCSIACSR